MAGRSRDPNRRSNASARFASSGWRRPFRLFGHFGWDHGGAGHITVRDPEFPDSFWVNPFGVHFSHVRVSDLLRVNHHAEVVEGGEVRRLNRAA